MATSTFLTDLTAESYAKAPVRDLAAYERKLEITQSYIRPDMEVMEFGCGTGTTAIAHAPHVRHIQAYDVSTKMLGIAQAKADAAGVSNVDFQQADIVNLSLPPKAYDVIMGHSILHLLGNKEAVIAKVFAALKPGGVFVSSTICARHLTGKWKTAIQAMRALRFIPVIPPVTIFSKDDLRRSITDAGFELDYDWAPNDEAVLFLVAKKPEIAAA